jgi:hydroxymethylpyrimidine/phosphomethylpyrimidine kinase
MRGRVLIVAGSDSGGGAGIQADIKAVTALGAFAATAVTALTAQNTLGVHGILPVPPEFLRLQIECVLADIGADGVKPGMLADRATIELVADILGRRSPRLPLVLDPVMVAKGGAALLAPDAVDALTERLLPLATMLTPNLPEAAALLHEREATSRAELADQARRLRGLGIGHVLVKGGHLDGSESPDVLASTSGEIWFEGPRIPTVNTHGTGCTLSSAIAAWLAKGTEPRAAVARAKRYLTGAIAASGDLSVGSGHGPVQHFHALWR